MSTSNCCYVTLAWAALQHETPHCGMLAEPTVVVSLYREDPVKLCQEPIASSIRILPVPPCLDETMNDAQQEHLWTSDDYIESIDPIVWDARTEIYAAARKHGYGFAFELWEGLDDIDVVDIAGTLAEPEVEAAPVAVN